MDDSARIQLAHSLQSRQALIAQTWYAAIARTSFVPFTLAQVREHLVELTGQAIALLVAGQLDPDTAQPIGAALARLHYSQPEALGRTLGVLARELVHGLPADQVLAVQPNLAALLEGVATGFAQQSSSTQLSEQESIRSALVSELRAVERQLRQARDHLEEQVQQRTEELRESEERWRSLVTSAPDSIFTLDPEGRILFANYLPPGSDFTTQDLLGRHPSDVVVPEHREAVRAAVEHVFATGTSSRYEAVVQRASGAVVWYAGHLGPLWRDGRVVAAILISRDVTERKRIEEMKDNLLRDVSHELNSPLARAQMSLELLLERLERDPIERAGAVRYTRMALDSVQKLVQTVKVILDLSRLEAGAKALAREPVRLADLIAAAILDMEPWASDKGLTLVANVADNLSAVQGDREKLTRVLRNLIDNAIKFSSAGQIALSAQRKHDGIEVSVSDTGCGILPENLERVFDRFFQESGAYAGVGVGLSMCRTIVEAHGGRIWAESAGRDQGATFRFTLPALDDPRDNPAAERAV